MSRTEWFEQAKWGVFAHYLAIPASATGGQNISVEDWNKQVDGFDVKGLAEQLEQCGAKYFFITLGQNSGFYISPNAVYDKLVGRSPSRCSRRDVVMELAEELTARGVRLMVYLPSHAPACDRTAVEGLDCTPLWDASKWQLKPGTYMVRNPEVIDDRLSAFQRNWEAVIREWSLRWADKVHGWWFDGCYYMDRMYKHDDEPNFKSFAMAARVGNANSIVAFNPGVKLPVVSVTEYEDYTAGEVNRGLPVEYINAPLRKTAGKALHILTFLGEAWGRGKLRFTAEFALEYTRHINTAGGVVTWDVPVGLNGLIQSSALEVLKKFRDNIK